jgi:hypothetical protein
MHDIQLAAGSPTLLLSKCTHCDNCSETDIGHDEHTKNVCHWFLRRSTPAQASPNWERWLEIGKSKPSHHHVHKKAEAASPPPMLAHLVHYVPSTAKMMQPREPWPQFVSNSCSLSMLASKTVWHSWQHVLCDVRGHHVNPHSESDLTTC